MADEKDTELEAPEGSANTDTAKGQETEKSEAKQHPEYEKTQQQLDQERANRRRIQTALEQAESEKDHLAQQSNNLQGRVTELEGQLKAALTKQEFANLANLDPNTTDVPDLVKNHQALVNKMAALEERYARAEQILQQQAQQELQRNQNAVLERKKERIYSKCDKRYGAQFRNEAIALADRLVEDHEVEQPTDEMEGLELMERCYEEVSKKHTPKTKEAKTVPPTDTGLRGLSVTDIEDSEEYKPGTLDQVAADMKKKMKGGKWKKAFSLSP